jgi:hypothetical protein
MRPYSGRADNLRIAALRRSETIEVLGDQGRLLKRGQREVGLQALAMDLGWSDSTLRVDRFELGAFGGDITGSLAMQLRRLQPLDVTLVLRAQVGNVNLAHLDPAAARVTPDTEFSALAAARVGLPRELDGRVDLTRLSLAQLDRLLYFLDPSGTNSSVQANRKLLSAWYMRLARPRVSLVSLWVTRGNLNLDIEMAALFLVQPILDYTLHRSRLRRLNLWPILGPALDPAQRPEEPLSARAEKQP